jgi:predicted RNA binding protein YcfA (HicA-like mRNA interferase family)
MRKQNRELVQLMRNNGFELHGTNKHLKFRNPDTGATIITANTPSDRRAIYNVRSVLRRACAQQGAIA